MKRKPRFISFYPPYNFFKPVGLPVQNLEGVVLSLDEFEALRLADFLGYYQEEAAKTMGVSRQTFGRILDSAHKKVAEAIIFGKYLKIEGGDHIMPTARRFFCRSCENYFDIPFGIPKPMNCPLCGSPYIHRFDRGKGPGRGKCRRNRWRQG
jgi:predicted DNA-binding protein (UPF0251 family)